MSEVTKDIAISAGNELLNIVGNLFIKHFTSMSMDDQSSFTSAISSDTTIPSMIFPGALALPLIMAVISIFEKLFPGVDSTAKYGFMLDLQKEIDNCHLLIAQDAIANAETELAAKSSNFWVQFFWAGLRPVAGWACVAYFIWAVFTHILGDITGFFGYKLMFTPLDMNFTYSMLMGLLGLGAMRSVDKYLGTNKDQ